MNIHVFRFLRAGFMICILTILAGNAFCAGSDTELQIRLENGNVAFSKGNFKEAITVYRELIYDYGFSPELLHNLANSYTADGRNGKAILNYLRGLRIAPGDDDLRADLALIRKQVGLFNDEQSLPERFFGYYDMNQWLIRALIGYILLTLLLAVSVRLHQKKGVFSCCFIIAGLIIACCAGAYVQQQKWNGGVIIQPETRLLLSPFKEAASNGSLIEGTLVYSQKKHNDYHYVHDETGRSGWIPSSSFEPINTSSLTYIHEGAEQ
jgi:tetratricopeptide (TPR) repeat protein